jgi:SAM-dependent methyltransferase
MRWEVLRRFKIAIENEEINTSSCVVVGGSSQDPELQFIKSAGNLIEVAFLGIEDTKDNFHCFDLNETNKLPNSWDFVLCSQVLEHVWNHKNFFVNLREMTKTGGHLWLSVPMSNFVHGSPDYYSAGFAPEYLLRNLEENNFEIIYSDSIGSKRYYLATHLLSTWLTEKEHANPLVNYVFQPGTKLGVLRKFLIDWVCRAPLVFASKRITNDPRFATESFVLAKKIR